jgi:hypothetical protein
MDDYKAQYRVVVPESTSLEWTLQTLEQDMRTSLSEMCKAPIESRWEKKPHDERDLVFYIRPQSEDHDDMLCAVLEFDKTERNFYVRDSSRIHYTRKGICDILDQQEMVKPTYKR